MSNLQTYYHFKIEFQKSGPKYSAKFTAFLEFKKHRHKKTNWISYGILRSIKFRDNLYMKY